MVLFRKTSILFWASVITPLCLAIGCGRIPDADLNRCTLRVAYLDGLESDGMCRAQARCQDIPGCTENDRHNKAKAYQNPLAHRRPRLCRPRYAGIVHARASPMTQCDKIQEIGKIPLLWPNIRSISPSRW